MASRTRKIRKIAVFTCSRAEYGILKPVMNAVKHHPQFELLTIAGGMHLSKNFGSTVKEICRDGFKISAKIKVPPPGNSNTEMASYLGKVIVNSTKILEELNPDSILILGDRVDILGVALAGSYMNILLAHIHGGDVSNAGLDEPARHSISKFAHIHFAATEKSAKRLIKMGEEPSRVHVTGAPGLDTILNAKYSSSENLAEKYGIDLTIPLILLIQHSVTTQAEEAGRQIEETLKAVKVFKYQTVIIYPNSDAGGSRIIRSIKKYEKYPYIRAFKSLPHEDYLGLMRTASVMVGNSSGGIIESSAFRLPVVNIGIRQTGRERSSNIIDVEHKKESIVKGIKMALHDEEFRRKLQKCRNSYGEGKASGRIVKILSKIKIDKKFLQKRITY